MTDPAIEALLRQAETARRRLGYDIATFKHRLDIPARLKESLQTHPTGWLGGSLVAGLLGSLALGRRKPKQREEKVKRAGLAGLALAAGGAVVRPLLKTAVLGLVKRGLQVRAGRLEERP